jgi:hypothetical protein
MANTMMMVATTFIHSFIAIIMVATTFIHSFFINTATPDY